MKRPGAGKERVANKYKSLHIYYVPNSMPSGDGASRPKVNDETVEVTIVTSPPHRNSQSDVVAGKR